MNCECARVLQNVFPHSESCDLPMNLKPPMLISKDLRMSGSWPLGMVAEAREAFRGPRLSAEIAGVTVLVPPTRI